MPQILTLILFADTMLTISKSDMSVPSNMITILMIMELLAAMHEKHYIVNLLLNPLFLWFYEY